jgi:hypothetical protein
MVAPPSLTGGPRMTMSKPPVPKLKQTATMTGKSPALGHKVALGSVLVRHVWDAPERYVPLCEAEKSAQALFPLLLAGGSQSNAALKELASNLYKEIASNAHAVGRGLRSGGETALSVPASLAGRVAGKRQAMNSLVSDVSEVPEIFRIGTKAQEAYKESLRNAFLNESAKSPVTLKAGRFAQRHVTPLSIAGGAAGVGLGAKVLNRTHSMPPEQYPVMEQDPYADAALLNALAETKTAAAVPEHKNSFLHTLGLALAGSGGLGVATGAFAPRFRLPLPVTGAILAMPIPGTTEMLGAYGAGKALGSSGTLAASTYLNTARRYGHNKAMSAATAAGKVPLREAYLAGRSSAISGLDALMHPLRTIDSATMGIAQKARSLLASTPGRSILSALRIKAAGVDPSKEMLLLSRAFGDTT